jgi:DNA mismatch endonuclease (patch repair protein)
MMAAPIKVPSYTGFRPASASASRAKRSNRKTDSQPERLLRQAVWRLGLRYRKNVGRLPGVPDLVFSSAGVVVFCDGDFWHGRHWRRLKRKLGRGTNAAYWLAKIARNIQRDRAHVRKLESAGWQVLRFWETDVKQDPEAAARQVLRTVRTGLRSGRVISPR